MKQRPKIIVILGPTSAGKTALSIRLARMFNGEVVSADSRQVYKDLDISSGKVTKQEMADIRHHVLDVVTVGDDYSVAQYQAAAINAINDILDRGKVPFVVGGTGYYIDSIVKQPVYPSAPVIPNLANQTIGALQARLEKLDINFYKNMPDKHNPRKLVRAIELATHHGHVPAITCLEPSYEVLQLGIELDRDMLREKIAKRTKARLQAGMVEEIKAIKEKYHVSWEKIESLGFDQKYCAWYLQEKISYDQMTDQLITKSQQYAKRQMTWFKRDGSISWLNPKMISNGDASDLVEKFIGK